MNQPGLMSRGQRARNLLADLDHALRRLRHSANRTQVVPLHQLHRNRQARARIDHLVNRQNVRMIQRRGRFGFPDESLHRRWIADTFRAQEFQCDRAIELRVAGRPHLAHTAPSQQPLNLIPPDLRTRAVNLDRFGRLAFLFPQRFQKFENLARNGRIGALRFHKLTLLIEGKLARGVIDPPHALPISGCHTVFKRISRQRAPTAGSVRILT